MNYSYLRNETIGYGTYLNGPFGKRLVTYADYTASGQSLRFIENYCSSLLETYANTHTANTHTGKTTMMLYEDAKSRIRVCVGANDNYIVLPAGSGSTGAIDKLSKILGIYRSPYFKKKSREFINTRIMDLESVKAVALHEAIFHEERPVVFISSYEHHSNEIQWREGHAEVVKIGLTEDGLFDMRDLVEKVSDEKYKDRLKIGSFSAASNVTGLVSPVYDIARIMHFYGGYVFFDFAAAGPYLEINMTRDDKAYFDGIYLSTHKFLGGPGSSGLLVLNKALYPDKTPPTISGGGTVRFVTEHDHEYVLDYEAREEAGTPGIMQVIRAALAIEVKDMIGTENIERTESQYIKKAMYSLKSIDSIDILGNQDPENRLAILSFNIRYKSGYLHHEFVAKLLNDLFGIQARAGCACAGPYGIKLLDIDDEKVERYKDAVRAEIGPMKPGWVRLNFHYTMDEATVDFIIEAIRFIAYFGHQFLEDYRLNCITGEWAHKQWKGNGRTMLSLVNALLSKPSKPKRIIPRASTQYKNYLRRAHKLRPGINARVSRHKLFGKQFMEDIAWFYYVPADS